MSLYALLRTNPEPSEKELEEAFDGNLCRCTGYRPILDAAKSLRVIHKLPQRLSELNSSSTNSDTTAKCSNGCGAGGCGGANGCGTANGPSAGCGREDCCKLQGGSGPSMMDVGISRYPELNLKPFDRSAQLIFPPALHRHGSVPLCFGDASTRIWYRPTTIDELLQVLSVHPDAKMVSGASEVQIEIAQRNMPYPIAIFVGDIPELRECTFEQEGAFIGANTTLTTVDEAMQIAIKAYGTEKSQPFEVVRKQLRYFAGRQVKNVATPAGNIATGSPISDLNPAWMALGATLFYRAPNEPGERALPMRTGVFTGYRKTAVPPGAFISRILIPPGLPGTYSRAYKQAKRKEDDIAIVTACFSLSVDPSMVITEAYFAFGGMAATPILAQATGKLLVGKPFGFDTLESAMDALEKEFQFEYSVPGGMPVYRRSIALSFLFRFWHDVAKNLGLDGVEEDAIEEIERSISKGERDMDSPYEMNVVGKAIPHLAALKHATGQARYVDDMPTGSTDQFGSMVLSARSRAKLRRVDPAPALEMPGVFAWVDHRDVASPKANYFGFISDEPFFAVDEVFCHGQPIGLILADSATNALAASRAVVVEYEDLPGIYTIDEAIAAESFISPTRNIRRGDAEKAMREADHVIEGVARMGGQEHFYLETQACYVVPKGEDGEMEVFSSAQGLKDVQEKVSQVTGVPWNRIVVRSKRMGGGFGGKESRQCQLAAILAVGAKKTGRPVRAMLNRDEDMMTTGQRNPFMTKWKVGVMSDGKLVALQAEVYNNAGWTLDLSGSVLDRAITQ
jgi:xanthine dehydrogenase/oxidase